MASKNQNAWEQVAHLTLLGALFTYVLGPIAILFNLYRELGPKPLGQWPPGREMRAGIVPTYPKARVEDLRQDLTFTHIGTAIGMTAALVKPWWGLI